MEKRRGRTRTVYLLGDFAFKFTGLFWHPWKLPHWYIKNRNWKGLWRFLRNDKGQFNDHFAISDCLKVVVGFTDNWREYMVWSKTKDPLFCRTYFSCGFLTVQQRVVALEEERGNIMPFINMAFAIRDDPKWELIDPHHFQNPENYFLSDRHLGMLDYGSSEVSEILDSKQGRDLIRLHLEKVYQEIYDRPDEEKA